MERQIEIGDFAEVNNELFKITNISDGEIIINFHDKPTKLIYEEDSKSSGYWKLPISSNLTKVYFRSSIFPTEVDPIDIEILNILDDKDLQNICKTNSHLLKICNSDSLWNSRIQIFFSKITPIPKNHTLTSKQLYFILKNEKNVPNTINYLINDDSVDLLQWLWENGYELPNDFILITYKGYIKVLDWLNKRDFLSKDYSVGKSLSTYAAYNNNLTLLNWFVKSHKIINYDEIIDIFIENNYITGLEWVLVHVSIYNIIKKAMKIENINVLNWARDNSVTFGIDPFLKDINNLIISGKLKTLKWVRENTDFLPNGAKMAIKHGQLEVLKWLIEEGAPLPTKEDVLESGNVEILKWLVEKGLQLSSKKDAHDALLHGNIKIVKWLEEKGVRL